MKWIILAGLWIGTLTAAFLVGRSGTVEPPPDVESGTPAGESVEALRAQIADLTQKLEEADAREAGGAEGAPREGGPGKPGDPSPLYPGAAPASAVEAMSLEGITTVKQFSDRLMAFVDAQLERGEPGYFEILKAMDLLEKNNDDLERLFTDEAAAMRELYPWVRYLVNREAQVVDFTEYVFRSMAENPAMFEGRDDNPLEAITEGLGVLLPGAVGPERMAVFQAYAEKILETPEEQQPEAVRKNRNEIERLLQRYWAEPVSIEQALEKLRSGQLSESEAARLLRGLPPEMLARIDVSGILGPLLASGRWEAIRALQALPAGIADAAVLDTHVLRGME
ncbi:MAG: hypothetical protein ACYS99_16070, partial [Planctomycetota bacterium]